MARIATNGRSVLIRAGGARVWTHFAGQLPEGVHYGARISVIGYLRTYNIGTVFSLVRACLLTESPQAMIRAALAEFPDCVVPPRLVPLDKIKTSDDLAREDAEREMVGEMERSRRPRS